jgi:Tol biopolymer transport system component
LIAYTTGADGAWQIMVADPATGETRPQPGLPANSGVAAWAPGGDTLAFRSKESGTWQIYAINVDGSTLRQLTQRELRQPGGGLVTPMDVNWPLSACATATARSI